MKILYAIQGTGNGHLSRAMDVVPCLQKRADVDILVSGIQGDLELPFAVKYQKMGLSFIFGKSGGVDLWKTFTHANLRKLVVSIFKLPVHQYDLVISDFEPVSSWACKLRRKPCISLSHQSAVLHPDYEKPDRIDKMGRYILKHYAPSAIQYGFHFRSVDDTISTPVVRKQVRQHKVSNDGHYTVYLPSYSDDKLVKRLSVYDGIKWDVFSKYCKTKITHGNIVIQPINNAAFTESMASSAGVLCGAGFETPAEALFLGKKLMVVPMKNQYEQQLNAAALKAMKIPVIKNLGPKCEFTILEWLEKGTPVSVHYPDVTQQIIDRIILNHAPKELLDGQITLCS